MDDYRHQMQLPCGRLLARGSGSSAASQHLDLFDKGFEMEKAHDVSSPEADAATAATTAVQDPGGGGEALQQVLNPGLGPVNVEWISGSWKKAGWNAVGPAAAVLLLAVFVATRIFAARGRKSNFDEPSKAGREKKPTQEPSREEEQQQEGEEGQEEGKTEKEGDPEKREREEEKEREMENAGAEKTEEERETERKEGTTQGNEGRENEEGTREIQQDGGTEFGDAQVALLQRIQLCISPATSLAASLNKTASSVLLGKLKKHLATAVEYQSAAVAGEPEAVATLAAANKGAALTIADFQLMAKDVVSEDARAAVACPEAEDIANAGYASTFQRHTGVSHFLELAWYRAVGVCSNSIRFLRSDGERIREEMNNVSSQSMGMVLPSAVHLSAARVAVESIRRCVKGQETAIEAAKQLQQVSLKLVKNNLLVELEFRATALAAQEHAASLMLQVAHWWGKMRTMLPEEAELLGKWDQGYKSAQEALSAAQQQLQLLKGETNVPDTKRTADTARMACERAATLFRDMFNGLPQLLPKEEHVSTMKLWKAVRHMKDIVSIARKMYGLPTAFKTIAEAGAATAQQVLEVGHNVQMQLSGLKELPWVPQSLLENVEKRLKTLLMEAKVRSLAVQEHVTKLKESPMDDPSFDFREKEISALTKLCKAVWELNAEVEMLGLLRGVVANAEHTKETALDMIAGDTILQSAESQRARGLKEQLEQAVTTAGESENLSDVVQAVGEYVSASEKLMQLAWMSKITSLLKDDPEATKELQATKAAQGKLQSATAEVVAQDGKLEQEKVPFQATATTASNQEEDFGRRTAAETELEEGQQEEGHEEGEDSDDQTGYETAPETGADEESESEGEYNDALELSGSS
ncbi:hypothetical protein EMWEY_00035280 [Eimeria maxima]|uniref:Uncharacterized protein n=1 Tax=Eimeria maxima TaxID=5804 RepID=U6MEE3_EIMMA|nr:hypothetical protein EMWEY_00035280 [Eimeria maxima]CDJ60834.1 hypothetical protein EMWEY_00035280 [Eimeria maxima]